MGYDTEIRVHTKVDTSQMQKLQIQIDKATNKVVTLSAKYDEIKNKKIPTDNFNNLEIKLKSAQNELEKLIAEENKLANAGLAIGAPWDNVIAKEADAQLKIENMQAEMQKLVENGKAFTIGGDKDEISKAVNDLSMAKAELKALATKQEELNYSQKKSKSNLSGITDEFKKIKDVSKKLFGSLGPKVQKTSGMLSTLASRFKGIALSLLIFNWITRGFNSMVAGMKVGFKNLIKYSDSYAESIADLKNANTQLQNSFAAAFAPIVQMIIPQLITFINYVTKAMNTIAQFVAVLSGKSSWIKATEVQGDYADSLNGTASAAKKAMGALASFDSLEVLNKKESSGGGGNAGGGFEEVPIDPEISNAAKNLTEWFSKLKAAAEPAIEAFQKLWNEGLSKLKDFSYGTLIDFYNNFLVPVGKWVLGEGLPRFFNITNDMLNEIDWDRLKKSLSGLYEALSGLTVFVFNALLDFYEYFLKPIAVWVMSSALPQLLDILTDLVNKVNWEELNRALKEFWEAVEPYAEQFAQGLIDFFSDMKDIGIAFLNRIAPILDSITKALNEGDPEEAKKWGEALAKIAIPMLVISKLFKEDGWLANLEKFGGFFKNAVWSAGIVDLFSGLGKIGDVEDILLSIPKEEDFSSIAEYNSALDEYKQRLDDLSQEQKNPFNLELDEETGIPVWFVEFIDKVKEEWTGLNDWWKEHAPLAFLPAWFSENVMPWFSAEKWSSLGQGILDGISTKWIEFCDWWNQSALGVWWEENVAPWFTSEKWIELAQGILDGISTKWDELVEWWDTNIVAWWDEYVAPWFTTEKWIELGDNMKKGIYNGFCGIVSKVVDVMNGIISACENMINFIIDKINELLNGANLLAQKAHVDINFGQLSPIKFGRVEMPKIPALANGAVLRGGNPMLAILNDQPAGQTNIEAPIATIEKALENVYKRVGNTTAPAANYFLQVNGQTFGELVVEDFISVLNRKGYNIDVLLNS